jgi:hypothetical protein
MLNLTAKSGEMDIGAFLVFHAENANNIVLQGSNVVDPAQEFTRTPTFVGERSR